MIEPIADLSLAAMGTGPLITECSRAVHALRRASTMTDWQMRIAFFALAVASACQVQSSSGGENADGTPVKDGATSVEAPSTSNEANDDAGVAAAAALPVPPPANVNVQCDSLWQDPVNHGKYWYEDNPHLTETTDTTGPWDKAAAADVGLNDAALETGLTWLQDGCGSLKCEFVQSAIVIRHGKMIKERYFNGATANRANNIHSAQKSMLSALVGIAIREHFIGSIDDPICKYLASEWPDACTGEKTKITVRDLLTMRSGLDWTEETSESKIQRLVDWGKQLLLLPQAKATGTTFNYSTANTHLMSKLLTKTTGMSTCEFGHRYLFAHLGMSAEHWASDDKGIFFGGCNSYWTPREMARFGSVIAAGGVYRGLQVIPADWVRDSLANHVATVESGSSQPHGYGYWYWNRTIAGHAVHKAWGFAGQMIYIVPSLDIVAVATTTTQSGEEERDIDFDEWLERFVIGAMSAQ